jgi:NAD(P) transhydrogenase
MNNMRLHGVDIFRGMGSFVDEGTIKVQIPGKTPEFLHGDVILIATGSSPRYPDNFPKHRCIYDSDSILRIKSMPRNMVVVGGGVIGCEYACIFGELGVDVSLVHSKGILLPFMDRDISLALENSMLKLGINLLMSESVESCSTETNGLVIGLGSGIASRLRRSWSQQVASVTPGS